MSLRPIEPHHGKGEIPRDAKPPKTRGTAPMKPHCFYCGHVKASLTDRCESCGATQAQP